MTTIRIAEFDTWRAGYGLDSVSIVAPNTETLLSIFTDEALTQAAANPQTLVERLDGGTSYGKFQFPLYVGAPYQLLIDSIDRTGIQRPGLTSFDGEDASEAEVTVTGGTEEVALEDILARRIDVRDFGEFIIVGGPGASSSTNNATLVNAIDAAASLGAGYVELPAGTYAVTAFTIPEGVVLRGVGRGVTVLQSTNAGNVATLSGDRAGFTRMTLDGVSLVALSVGVLAVNIDQIVLDDAEVKRFETGIYRKGGVLSEWRQFFLSNCVTGYKCHGDNASSLGGAIRFNRWDGGLVELCTTAGIELKNVDSSCDHNDLLGISFDTNTGTAVKIIGARATRLQDCLWSGNTANLSVQDGSPLTANNSVVGLEVIGGEVDGGTLTFADTYRAISFRRVTMNNPVITISAPGQNIVVEDCDVSNPTISGVPTCWLYHQANDRGASLLVTSDNTAHKAWGITLKSGQKVYLEGKVVGRQRNGINTGFYHVAVSAGRVGASLAYDTQSANFTVGQVLTGATSGATARITADSDSGTTGTLTIQDIVGTFVDNEIITDPLGGSALANGAISESNAALIGTVTAIRAAQETNANWNATFAANGAQIELQVTGDTAQTVEWSSDVDVTQDQGSPIVIAQASVSPLTYHGLFSGFFAAGQRIKGVTSGATGTVVTGSVATSGTLALTSASGSFQNGEFITQAAGEAVVVGAVAGP